MQIDKLEHQEALLDLIKQASFQGHMIEFVHELKKAIENAKVTPSQRCVTDPRAAITPEE